MHKHQNGHQRRETKLADAGFARDEQALLLIARRYFLSYTRPEQPYWESAIDLAVSEFGPVRGAALAVALLNVIRAMRSARTTVFNFINPTCPDCAAKLSECERVLIQTIRSVRSGDAVGATTQALILCEGRDTEPILYAAAALVDIIGPTEEVASTPCKRPEPSLNPSLPEADGR